MKKVLNYNHNNVYNYVINRDPKYKSILLTRISKYQSLNHQFMETLLKYFNVIVINKHNRHKYDDPLINAKKNHHTS